MLGNLFITYHKIIFLSLSYLSYYTYMKAFNLLIWATKL